MSFFSKAEDFKTFYLRNRSRQRWRCVKLTNVCFTGLWEKIGTLVTNPLKSVQFNLTAGI
jgi:hypothetical protein